MNPIIHPIEPEELMAYLDGELAADRASATAAHLGGCAECQTLAAEFRNVSQNLRVWDLPLSGSSIPPGIAAALAKNQPESGTPANSRRNWREKLTLSWDTAAWMWALAAVCLVMIGTVRFIGRGANDVFSQVGSALGGDAMSRPREAVSREAPAAPESKQAGAGKVSHGLFNADVDLRSEPQTAAQSPAANGPMIIRTAQLSLITKEFDKARANLEAILQRHRGYVGELKVGGATGSGRRLTATLRVPADQLDATLAEVKTVGRVESESQSGQDVTSQYVDLQARLANARNTEQRLTDLLRNRTGKLSDVLEVEQELDRVRGEIEQMEAERKNMTSQVTFATLNATITEDYRAELQVVPPSTSTRLGNAAVEGYRTMEEGVLSVALFLLTDGPSLLLWGVVLFLPARIIWKKLRRRSLAA